MIKGTFDQNTNPLKHKFEIIGALNISFWDLLENRILKGGIYKIISQKSFYNVEFPILRTYHPLS